MAKDETKDTLLTTLTNRQLGEPLPARGDEREDELREPAEPSREEEEGRKPEEVVRERETKLPVERKPEPLKKYKVRVDDGPGEPAIQELTLGQLAERGLLDKLITTSNQFPTVQKKYQELLERTAGKEPAKPEEKQSAKAPPPTPAQLRNIYAPLVKEQVDGGYIEPDFAEAYPDLCASLMYFRDIIEDATGKLAHVIKFLSNEVELRNAYKVLMSLNNAIEAVAVKGDGEKGDPLFKDLRKLEVREKFAEWIRTEVDPKVGSLTPENMEKFWFAFNAREILDFTKETARKKDEPPPPRRRAAGDGAGTRQGGPTPPSKEKSLLDRLSEIRLGPEA